MVISLPAQQGAVTKRHYQNRMVHLTQPRPSAAAHALSQFALGRTIIQEEPENNSPAVGALVADVEHDIGPAFLGTFMILKTAFDLYDLRRCDPIELLNGSAPSLRQ